MSVQSLLVEDSVADDLETLDIRSFLEDRGRGGRHGSRKYPSDVCVVPTRGGKEDDFTGVRIEYWGDDSDIREMSVED
jgi:hypothetical protein